MAQQRLDVWCDRLALVGVDVVDSQLYGSDFFSVFVRDFAAESFFQSHNQFYGVQRICAQVVLEGRFILTSASFTPSCSATIFLTCCSMFDISVVPFALRRVV